MARHSGLTSCYWILIRLVWESFSGSENRGFVGVFAETYFEVRRRYFEFSSPIFAESLLAF